MSFLSFVPKGAYHKAEHGVSFQECILAPILFLATFLGPCISEAVTLILVTPVDWSSPKPAELRLIEFIFFVSFSNIGTIGIMDHIQNNLSLSISEAESLSIISTSFLHPDS